MRLLLIPIFLLLASCSESYLLGVDIYQVGACVEEVNKTYYDGYAKNKVYRVDQRRGSDYFLSTYQNKKWLDIRARNVTYFTPSKNFEYQQIDCPGSKAVDRGIANKVKKIEGLGNKDSKK